uniref:K-box domain-containing protein n=1 Tax=Salix viminalis TaxID=40686 RepID=A0A6N2K5V2_SALVM
MDCSRKLVSSPFFVTCKSPSSSFQVYCGKHANFKSHAELLLMVERNLEGPHAMELTLSDLVELEKQLDAALTHVRARKIQLMLESVKSLHDQEKMLTEENQLLEKQIVALMKDGKDSDHTPGHPPQQTTLTSILKRYESRFEKVATANHAEVNCGKHANFKSHAELLLMIERNLEGPQAMELTLSDLVELEKQLDAALTHVRARKIQLMLESVKSLHDQTQLMLESVKSLNDQEKMLTEENQLLEKQIVALMKDGKDSDHTLGKDSDHTPG